MTSGDAPLSTCYSKDMATVTIPKELGERTDLVAVPRSAFEEFVAWQKQLKSARTFTPTAADKRALAKARKNRTQGHYLTLNELQHSMERNR